MRKSIVTLFLGIITFTKLNAQDFSFKIYFEDALSNKDSLLLGYDVTASDTLDIAWGESNIITAPYKAGIDVRVSNVWLISNYAGVWKDGTNFDTKKQILPNTCSGYWNMPTWVFGIDVVSKNFPITVSWDSTLFADTCLNGSLLTSVHPGCWFDCGGGFRELLNKKNSFIIDEKNHYYKRGADTVAVYWLALNDSSLLSSGVHELSQVAKAQIFPNPAKNNFQLKLDPNFGEVTRVDIYNLFGQLTMSTQLSYNISIANFPVGIYLLHVFNKRGDVATARLLKE